MWASSITCNSNAVFVKTFNQLKLFSCDISSQWHQCRLHSDVLMDLTVCCNVWGGRLPRLHRALAPLAVIALAAGKRLIWRPTTLGALMSMFRWSTSLHGDGRHTSVREMRITRPCNYCICPSVCVCVCVCESGWRLNTKNTLRVIYDSVLILSERRRQSDRFTDTLFKKSNLDTLDPTLPIMHLGEVIH